MKDVEKCAMSSEDKMKYLKYALASGIAAAGIGAVAKEIKARKMRDKALDASTNKNAIIVPIKKSKFMEGLPTPGDLAKERGETGSSNNGVSTEAKDAGTPADIAAAKKAILGKGRRMDFFRKSAAEEKSEPDSKDKKDGVESKGEPEKKKDGGESRVILRDQTGKFVSPTDPVAVEQVEKTAGIDWILDTIAHPVASAGKMWDAAKEKPVLYAAGALGSIYVAAKITEYLNNMRKERSKERVEDAREKYVSLLQGGTGEKAASADPDPRYAAGTVLGSAFLVPLALTALVTNRIIENRKEDEKKKKDMSDSFPEEPIVLYKTSSDNNSVQTTPEAILSVILVKRGMFLAGEREEREAMAKSAQEVQNGKDDVIGRTIGKVVDTGKGAWNTLTAKPFSEQEAADWAVGRLTDPINKKHLLAVSRASAGNDAAAVDKAFSGMLDQYKDDDSYRFRRTMATVPGARDKVKGLIRTSPKLEKALVDGYTNDPDFKKHTEEMIGKNLSGTFRPGSLIHSLMSWIAGTFGIGRNKAVQAIRDRFANAREQMEASRMATAQPAKA